MLIKQEYYEEAYAVLNPYHLRFRFCHELASGQQLTPAELTTELWFDAADSATVVHPPTPSASGATSRATTDTPPKRRLGTAPPSRPES